MSPSASELNHPLDPIADTPNHLRLIRCTWQGQESILLRYPKLTHPPHSLNCCDHQQTRGLENPPEAHLILRSDHPGNLLLLAFPSYPSCVYCIPDVRVVRALNYTS